MFTSNGLYFKKLNSKLAYKFIKLSVFLEPRSRKTGRFSEHIMSAANTEHIFAPNGGYCSYNSLFDGLVEIPAYK